MYKIDGKLKYCLRTTKELVHVATLKKSAICIALVKPKQVVLFRKDNGKFIRLFEYVGIHFPNDPRMSLPTKHLRKQFKKPNINVEVIGCCISPHNMNHIYIYSNELKIIKDRFTHHYKSTSPLQSNGFFFSSKQRRSDIEEKSLKEKCFLRT